MNQELRWRDLVLSRVQNRYTQYVRVSSTYFYIFVVLIPDDLLAA